MAELDDDAELRLRSARNLTRERLRLGTDAPIHAMPVLAEFTARYPTVELSLVSGNADSMLKDVLEHRVDAALVSNIVEGPTLSSASLLEDRFVAYMHRDDPLAERSRLRLAEVVARSRLIRMLGRADAVSRLWAQLQGRLADIDLDPEAATTTLVRRIQNAGRNSQRAAASSL